MFREVYEKCLKQYTTLRTAADATEKYTQVGTIFSDCLLAASCVIAALTPGCVGALTGAGRTGGICSVPNGVLNVPSRLSCTEMLVGEVDVIKI